jgi:hypothetical protein
MLTYFLTYVRRLPCKLLNIDIKNLQHLVCLNIIRIGYPINMLI